MMYFKYINKVTAIAFGVYNMEESVSKDGVFIKTWQRYDYKRFFWFSYVPI